MPKKRRAKEGDVDSQRLRADMMHLASEIRALKACFRRKTGPAPKTVVFQNDDYTVWRKTEKRPIVRAGRQATFAELTRLGWLKARFTLLCTVRAFSRGRWHGSTCTRTPDARERVVRAWREYLPGVVASESTTASRDASAVAT